MHTVLIAEDDGRIAAVLVKALRIHGIAARVIGDGDDVLTASLSGQFALLILDLGLPGKDGLAVLRELRAARSDLPVIVLTGRAEPTDQITALAAGAHQYLIKPYRLADLIGAVRHHLQPAHPPDPSTATST